MLRWIALALVASASLGCGALNIEQSLPWSEPTISDKTKYSDPETMIVIWNESIYSEPGKAPMRGFGGRVYFYDKHSRPIPVDGEFICYAFDESTGDGAAKTRPDRKFEFTREQFTRHFGESDIGASYSIWLPWDGLGNPQRNISLYPMFRTVEGKVVRAAHSKHVLPGKQMLTDEQRRGFHESQLGEKPRQDNWITDGRQVKQVNHVHGQAAARGGDENARRTTTFRVNNSLADRLHAAKSLSGRAEESRKVADQMVAEYRAKVLAESQAKRAAAANANAAQTQNAAPQNASPVRNGQVSLVKPRQRDLFARRIPEGSVTPQRLQPGADSRAMRVVPASAQNPQAGLGTPNLVPGSNRPATPQQGFVPTVSYPQNEHQVQAIYMQQRFGGRGPMQPHLPVSPSRLPSSR